MPRRLITCAHFLGKGLLFASCDRPSARCTLLFLHMRMPFHSPLATPPARYCGRSSALYRGVAVLAVLLGMLESGFAAQVPLPPERPLELQQDSEPAANLSVAPPAEAPSETVAHAEEAASPPHNLPAACAALANAGIITVSQVGKLKIPRPCALPDPVSLTAVHLDDGTTVDFKPAAVMNCEMVIAMANWTREDLAPSLEQLGAKLKTLRVASAYSCRGRNRKAGARTSEHGYGNAMDVGGFVLSNDRDIPIAPRGMPNAFALAMKESACRRFTTVLGPGSDGHHETHIHVDLAQRRNGFKLCRWRLPGSTTPERRYVRASATEMGQPETSSPSDKTQRTPSRVPLPPVRPDIPAQSAEQ